jgi:hypothetical protein
MARNPAIQVVYAKTSTSTGGPSGFPVVVRRGEAWDASDAFVQEHPELFSPTPMVRNARGDWYFLDET